MKIYDITKELLGCKPFSGDRPAELSMVKHAERDGYNLSDLSISVHNGTHIDAPLHFIADGADTASLELSACVGSCVVINIPEPVDAARARIIIETGEKRILIKGGGLLTPRAAEIFCGGGVVFVGVETESPALPEDMAAVHTALLGHGIAVAENLDLRNIEAGCYFLFAAPLKISGAEGAPCRAVLVDYSGI